MQFIEKNSFSVRSAVYRFTRDGVALEFVVFPMIHFAEQKFYDQIGERLSRCDLILIEGVASSRAMLLTLSYRLIARIRRLDLVTQQKGLHLAHLREKTINADIEKAAFDNEFSALPFLLKLRICALVPFATIYLFLFGSREVIAEHLAFEDLPSAEEVLLEDEGFEQLDSLLLNRRDKVILESIETVFNENRNRTITVGILFGAAHLRAIVPFIMQRLKFRVASAEWVTVFDL